MTETQPYFFPPPPSPEAPEWEGSPIGKSNIITRTKGRTAVHDKIIDRTPGKREALLESIYRYHRENPGAPEHQQDVIIHGIRVRAMTNSPHLYDFWVDNWYSPEEWRAFTGQESPAGPQIQVFAYGGVKEQPEAAYYSRKTNTIIFFNTSYYGQLKSWVLGAVGRVLAEEYGIHSVHGACVEVDKKGVLYIAPTGTGKSTSSYGLMGLDAARFHSDDWVYIRYAHQAKDGRRIAPVSVTPPDGEEVQGFRVFRWLEEYGRANPEAQVVGLGLDNSRTELKVRDLDLSQPPQAYAYISEKIFYLRSNLVENFPLSAYEMVHSKLENVPDVSPQFYAENDGVLRDLARELIRSSPSPAKEYFSSLGQEPVAGVLARFIVFDNARAMLNISKIFTPKRVFTNPMEPVILKVVFLLKRNFNDDVVLETLPEEEFIIRLHIGETPDGKKETAYNAYRAVDDQEERAFIDEVLAEAQRKNLQPYQVYERRMDIPETLQEEFELFRILHKTTGSYHLNTILGQDPQVTELREAVRLTMDLIARVIGDEPSSIRLTLADYRRFLEKGRRV